MDWLTAFILTLCIELPVLSVLLREEKIEKVLFVGLLMNSITHPSLWFIFPNIIPKEYYILVGELLVTLIEFVILCLFFRKQDKLKLLLISFIVNSLSFLTGEMIYLFMD
jgi:hypothetical protein